MKCLHFKVQDSHDKGHQTPTAIGGRFERVRARGACEDILVRKFEKEKISGGKNEKNCAKFESGTEISVARILQPQIRWLGRKSARQHRASTQLEAANVPGVWT